MLRIAPDSGHSWEPRSDRQADRLERDCQYDAADARGGTVVAGAVTGDFAPIRPSRFAGVIAWVLGRRAHCRIT
jgi:hypothetical protein